MNPAVDPSLITSESVIIFDPKNPPTPENDCVGKYWNPTDVGCAGDPNSKDAKYQTKCVCYEECAVKTKQRVEGNKDSKKKAVKGVKKDVIPDAVPTPATTAPVVPAVTPTAALATPAPVVAATPPVAPAAPVAPVPTSPPEATPAPVAPKPPKAAPVAKAAAPAGDSEGNFDPQEFMVLTIPGLTPEFIEQYKAVYFKDAAGDYPLKVFPTPRKKRYVLYSIKEFAGFEKRNGKYFTGPMSKVSLVMEHIKLFAA